MPVTDLLGIRDITCATAVRIEKEKIWFLISSLVLLVQQEPSVWRRILEQGPLFRYGDLLGPAALSRDPPDVEPAGNICVEIDMLAIRGPSKRKDCACEEESLQIKWFRSLPLNANEWLTSEFCGWRRDHDGVIFLCDSCIAVQ